MVLRQAQDERKKKKEYSFEVVDTAESLYIHKQKTYDEIAALTGVSVAQIQRWSEKYEWRKKRLEQVKLRVDYRRNLYVLRDQMLQSAMASTDPQIVHGIAALQKAIEGEEKAKSPDEAIPTAEEFLKFMREMVAFLKDRDPEALAALERNFDEFTAFAKNKYAS